MPSPVELPHLDTALSRRRWLAACAALPALGLPATLAAQGTTRPASPFQAPPAGTPPSHAPFGRVYPQQPPPDLRVTLDDGRPAALRTLLRGRVTALQLMFTGCSATCPIQGALFAEVARRGLHRDVQLVSFSIDPLGDSPQAMREWMQRHGAHAAWRGVVPRPEDQRVLPDFLRGTVQGPDPHTGNVHFFDRAGRYVYKTADLPSPREIVSLLAQAVAAA